MSEENEWKDFDEDSVEDLAFLLHEDHSFIDLIAEYIGYLRDQLKTANACYEEAVIQGRTHHKDAITLRAENERLNILVLELSRLIEKISNPTVVYGVCANTNDIQVLTATKQEGEK